MRSVGLILFECLSFLYFDYYYNPTEKILLLLIINQKVLLLLIVFKRRNLNLNIINYFFLHAENAMHLKLVIAENNPSFSVENCVQFFINQLKHSLTICIYLESILFLIQEI